LSGHTTEIEQFEAETSHPVEQGMQVGLLELARQHRGRRLDIHLETIESLACDRPESADNPDLVRGSSQCGLPWSF
jgi:hypothetical protein